VVPEPEPIIDPEPAYIPEPEPIVAPESEPVYTPEPEVEKPKMSADDELNAFFGANDKAEKVADIYEPVEPENVAEPETVAVPEVSDEPEMADEPEDTDDDVFESENTKKSGGLKWLFALIACLIGLAGGYLLGSYYPYTKLVAPAEEASVVNVQKVDVSKIEAPEPKAEEVPEEVAPVEEPAAEPQNKEAEAKAKAEAAAKAKAEADAKAAAEKAASEAKAKDEADAKAKAAQNKYDAMDVRVRLGAYRIVGTDKTVKVKEGENLVKISRRYLGPDMECYLEVFNNIKASTPLKVGQEIKIPKLEWKKKKKAATAN
jgi:chemotaxis protein histidine kinase CheA